MRNFISVLLVVPLIGCNSSWTFDGSRDVVFGAALEAVPNCTSYMELTRFDPEKGTFEGQSDDPMGSISLRGRVYPARENGDTRTVVDVDCWSWGIETLFLFPFRDDRVMEDQFLDTVGEKLTARTSAGQKSK
jgi:hypothetical protein